MIIDVCLSISEASAYSPAEFYAAAKQNGWNAVAAVTSSELCAGVIPCVRIHTSAPKELQKGVRSAAKNAIIIADAGENSFNRFVLTQKGVHFLAGLENLPKNGFDHITAKLAAEKNVGLVIELAAIIDYRTRKSALSAYADILKLQRKYRFPLVIASGAKTPLGIRSIYETEALCSLFGMTRAEVYAALNGAEAVLHPKESVEVAE
ncbi:MAG: hypothetical protein MJ116_08085 [Lachnospiraceae bacterium]|nr:hypothetical protein [Lachnospiraceae bacterium]